MHKLFYTLILLTIYIVGYSQVQTNEVDVIVNELENYKVEVSFNPTVALSGVDVLPVTILFKVPDSENLAEITVTPDAGNFLEFSLANTFTFNGFHYISYQTTAPTPVAGFPQGTETSVGQFTIGGVTSSVTIAETDFGPPPAGSGNWVGTAMVQENDNLLTYPIQNSNVSLPVSISKFGVTKTSESSAKLTWSSEVEVGFSHYEIERSIDDAARFVQIGKIVGNGNSNTTKKYAFDDIEVPTLLNETTNAYYRLKMVDFNGKFEYSEVRLVTFQPRSNDVVLYPNPSTEFVTVSAETKVESITIYGIDGKLVYTQEHANKIDVTDFDSGMYKVFVATEAGMVTKTLIKID